MSQGQMEYLVPLDAPGIESFEHVHSHRFARKLAKALVFIFLMLIVALAFVPWQQTAFGEGQVVAYSPTERQQNIDAPVEGWLEEWYVQEGSRVQAGDPIVRIVDNDPNYLERIRLEQQAAHARLAAAESAINTAARNVRRQWDLYKQGLSSRKAYEDAQLKEADTIKELAASRAELARADVKLTRQGRQMVTASRSGIILRRAFGEGSVYIKVGANLATIVPETRSRAVEIWLDGNDLPLLRKGQEVRIQFEGWPAIQFSGWPSVAVGTFRAEVSIVDVAQIIGRPGEFRILVVPTDNHPWPDSTILRQGVRAHGWALLNQVPLGYELWRRFNNFPPTMPTVKKPKGGGASDASKGGEDSSKDSGDKDAK